MKTLDLIGSQCSVVTSCLLVLGQLCEGQNYPRAATLGQESPGVLHYA